MSVPVPANADVVPPLPRATGVLLNVAHAIDHMFLLIFATAVASIATDFGVARWEDLMPYGVGAFAMFGLGSLPAGRLGDLWGRRRMMLVFYFGMGASALLAALTQSTWQLAAALTLLGLFSAIYHPVGIPMLVQRSTRPGLTIGINGLSGNLGVALSAVATGALVKYAGWRMAFVVPAMVAFACGIAFARLAPHELVAPARRRPTRAMEGKRTLAHVFAVVTVASVSGSLLFNFTTNGNGELLRERFRGIVEDPAALGALLALVYVAGAFTQVAVGLLLDRLPLKLLYAGIVAAQAPLFLLAAHAGGWQLYALMVAFMVAVFGAIPFTDAIIVRYVDDRMRSRVSGMRLAVAFGVSSLAVWLLGPLVKTAGFDALLLLMAAIAIVTLCVVLLLPRTTGRGLGAGADEGAARAAD
ncbi:MAG TPA: MFS transporter [Casimicrobiaceae bacterium]|nr:MFS transporter [Casimicrobiaceae bacterium]